MQEEKAHSIYIKLSINGDYASTDLIAATGLVPDEIYERGSALPSGRIRPTTLCHFAISQGPPLEAMDHLKRWGGEIRPHVANVRQFLDSHNLDGCCLNVVIKLVADSLDPTPPFHMDNDLVALLADLGAHLDCDLYY